VRVARFDWSSLLRRRPPALAAVTADASALSEPRQVPAFCIVTPVFNGAEYIDETILSVITQGGEFDLHYHVQDGGSTDDTLAKVQRWQKLAPELKACRNLVFTCTSEPDSGMYDAVNRGFVHALPPGDDTVMGWIASDDRIAPGAFATILAIRGQYPDIRFMGGRISLLDHHGSILGIHPLVPFSRRCMAAGLHDGRRMSFIMQEGSFWCADLWRKAGGLDTRFRLAGDWDLWRRLAAHAEYVSVDGLLGFHRRRPGQLSEQMGLYYSEVDGALDLEGAALPAILEPAEVNVTDLPAAALRDAYGRVAEEYEAIRRDPPRFRASPHSSTAVRYNLDSRRWDRMSGFGAVSDAPLPITAAGATEGSTVLLREGFRAAEGPYPEYGLLMTIRWMIAPTATGEVTVEQAGHYRVILRCRGWIAGQRVSILADGRTLGQIAVTPHEHDRDLELSVQGWLGAGINRMSLTIDQPEPAELYLLIIDWRVERLADADADADAKGQG
jgi:GT2 family glycosyltransferase